MRALPRPGSLSHRSVSLSRYLHLHLRLRGLDFAVSAGDLLAEDDVPGPATPTSFREQCYLDRERLEKKVPRGSKPRGR